MNIKMNKITTEIALKRINDKIKETNTTLYVVNFEYIKKKSIIYMKCRVCGKEVERDYWRFIHAGGKCECQYKYRRWTEERCIEFDGEQHFKPVEHLGGEKHYNNTVINDEIKMNFVEK